MAESVQPDSEGSVLNGGFQSGESEALTVTIEPEVEPVPPQLAIEPLDDAPIAEEPEPISEPVAPIVEPEVVSAVL